MTSNDHDAVDLRERAVPPWVLLLFALTAAGIGLMVTERGDGTRVDLAGAGLLSVLTGRAAPPGLRYVGEAAAQEPLETSIRRIEDTLSRYPRLLVFGLDAAAVEDPAAARARFARLLDQVEGTATVSVAAGFSSADPVTRPVEWTSLCRDRRRVLCVDLQPHAARPDEAARALEATLVDAATLLDGLRASTQLHR